MKWKIGDVEIKNRVVLAPMAGICDSAFRTIIKSMGCGLIGTEMVSAKAIMYNDERTKRMLYMGENERPISQQIFGSDVKSFKIASKFVYEYMKPDIIDINMGCPVQKVAIKSQSGCALLKDPDKAFEIVKAVVDEVPVPVTVKMRSGWDENNVNAVEIAKLVEKAGASAIAVHPRLRTQKYVGHSDWNIIKQVKDEVSIPVIGNGDIKSCYDGKRMIDETGCDAIMIGRGVLGNPWLIKECIDYLEYGIEPRRVTYEEKLDMIKKHTELLIKIRTEEFAIPKMRSHVAYYMKGLPRSVEFKPKVFKVKTKKELFDLIDEYGDYIASLID